MFESLLHLLLGLLQLLPAVIEAGLSRFGLLQFIEQLPAPGHKPVYFHSEIGFGIRVGIHCGVSLSLCRSISLNINHNICCSTGL